MLFHVHPFRLNLPRLAEARVRGGYADVAVRTAKELGADLRLLGEACGLGDLTRPLPEDIGVRNYLQLLDAGSRILNDPLFGLHVGERMRHADMSGYGLALMACPTFREVAALKLRYEGLAHDLGRSEIVIIDGLAHTRWHSPWDDLPGSRHLYESVAAAYRVANNFLAGFVAPVNYVSFKHERPAEADLSEYDRVLASEVRFSAEVAEGVFPAAYYDLPVPGADGSLLSRMTQVIDQRLAQHERTRGEPAILGELRSLTREQMIAGRANLEAVAKAAGCSPRTLQRRLTESGSSYSQLLDEVRRESARDLVRDRRMSLTDIAFFLGYSEQSTFHHAFRKWFGVSPGKWRE